MIACPYCGAELPLQGDPGRSHQLVGCTKCLDASLVHWDDGSSKATRLEGVQSRAEMAPAGSVMEGVFAKVGEVIADLPVLPAVPQRIMAMIHDPITSISDLAEIIRDDAAIAMKIMSVSNSALYTSPTEIKDLRTACARLGMRTIANVVNAAANGNVYRSGEPAFRNIMLQLWQHAVATAHCADEIAVLTRCEGQQVAFLAGLVHDIGKLVLVDTITVRFSGNIGRLRESPQLLVQVVNRFHPLVGLHVAQYWRMAPECAFTTYYNHQPDALPVEQWKPLTHAIHLASHMADTYGYMVGSGEPSDLADHPSIAALGLAPDKVEALQLKLPESLSSLIDVLGAP